MPNNSDDKPLWLDEAAPFTIEDFRRYSQHPAVRDRFRQFYMGQFIRHCASCKGEILDGQPVYEHPPTGEVAHVRCPEKDEGPEGAPSGP